MLWLFLIQGCKLVYLKHLVFFFLSIWRHELSVTLSEPSSPFFSGLTCDCVHVTVKDDKKFAMLFSSVVLQCNYNTHSSNAPVVQWWYKSYCTDRIRESFSSVISQGDESYLECPDKSRTIHIVASKQGDTLKLANQYKGRDISIINSNVS